MLWSGDLGLKMGSQKWHIPNMHIMEVPPPPPGSQPFPGSGFTYNVF